MAVEFSDLISRDLDLKPIHVENTLKLFVSGCTVPFIARYRKEMTGCMDEETVIAVRDCSERYTELNKRKKTVIDTIEAQGKLSKDLLELINECSVLSELEDIYLPYKPKKITRSEIAIKRGLKPLAELIFEQGLVNLSKEAEIYINYEKDVNNIDDALSGARDIIAGWVNENKSCRASIRKLFSNHSVLTSKLIKGKEKEGEKYKDYFNSEGQLLKIPSHRYLAIIRGEKEGFLNVSVRPPEDKALDLLKDMFVKNDFDTGHQVALAVKDSYKRLMAPSMENEVRANAKIKADKKAIAVFAENLRQLLLAPPLGQKSVLAVDPAFRTGCKVVCLDKYGDLLHNETIYPLPPQNEKLQAMKKIISLVSQYKIEAIAVGNGTGGREIEALIRKTRFDRDIIAVMVNESGASIYSASKVARDEFPDYDITVRGAVSIGRRLQDPLAELVKIEPKSIGVGQYQHDVDQKALESSLSDTVVSCVNLVGVDVNIAGKQLLTYISGIGPALADQIVNYRKINGPFKLRDELKSVPRLGDKAFEQAAGFLRVNNSENPLDKTAVHPEAYPVVKKIAKDLNFDVSELIANKEARRKIIPEDYVTGRFGLPTIIDILKELDKPGRDPRVKFELFEFDKKVNKISDLEPGMELNGIVTNITAFGAFVDIGVHQDGLIHISQIADEFVSDVNDHLKLNQKLKVRVLHVEEGRKRIQLSLKGVQNIGKTNTG